MIRHKYLTFFILILFSILSLEGKSQESVPYRKTAISFNLTRLAVNELNISFERFLSQRRSIEFYGGLVYSNSGLQDAIDSWTKDPLFLEHGFDARFYYKVWVRKENSKWRNYVAPGLLYKHLYYKELTIQSEIKYDHARPYVIDFKQDRTRDKFGIELLWGKVYEASRTFAFEFYYGGGVVATSVERRDYSRFVRYINAADQSMNQNYPQFIDESFYVRPVISLGMKLTLRM
jgi:hypothetical protein